MSEGYSYATISAHRDEPVRIAVSLYLDERAHVLAVGGGDACRAHLSVSMGDVSVTVGPADPAAVTAGDLRIARHLAGQAAAYADAVERLAAADQGGPAAA